MDVPRRVAADAALLYCCNPRRSPLPQALVEMRDVRSALESSGWTVFELRGGDATELCAALAQHRPRVLHFIGHADAQHRESKERTLALTDRAGRVVTVAPRIIADLLAAHDIDLCFLNGCRSADLARAIADRGIPSIGWETDALDLAAAIFAPAVYAKLRAPRSIRGGCSLEVEEMRRSFEHGLRTVVDTIAERRGGVSRSSSAAVASGAVRLQFDSAADPLKAFAAARGVECATDQGESRRVVAGVPLLLLPPDW